MSDAMTQARGGRRAFPRQFWLLTGGILVLLAGVDMCFPFETIYLNTRLGVSMTTIGLVLGLPILVSLPLHIVGGALTDKYGRRPAMATGVCIISGLYLTFAFAGSLWPIALALAIEAGFGWALFLTGSNAMIADLVGPERRSEAYAITRVALNVGMVLGPLFARLLLSVDPTFRAVFVTGAALCLGFVIIVLTMFRETRPAAAKMKHDSLVTTLKGYGVVLHDDRFIAFCAIALLPLYGFGQLWSIFPVALQMESGISATSWSTLLMTYALCSAIIQYPVVRLLRRRNHIMAMAISSACLGIGLAGALLVPWGAATFGLIIVLSLGVVILIPISATVASELAPVALRGRYMGAWTLVQMGGYALGPVFGGWALDALGPRLAFTLIGVLALTGSLLFALNAKRLRPAPDDLDRAEAGDDGDREGDALSSIPPAV